VFVNIQIKRYQVDFNLEGAVKISVTFLVCNGRGVTREKIQVQML